MTQKHWAELEAKIDALLDSHARLREDKRRLAIEAQELKDRNAELAQRLERVIGRIKRLETETDA